MSVDEAMQAIFLEKICKNYLCGTQLCDGSADFLEGCTLYQRFKQGISELSNTLLSD